MTPDQKKFTALTQTIMMTSWLIVYQWTAEGNCDCSQYPLSQAWQCIMYQFCICISFTI